jgi:hypothetical protein
VAKFRAPYQHSMEGLRKITEILSHDGRFKGQDLCPVPPEYEAGKQNSRIP